MTRFLLISVVSLAAIVLLSTVSPVLAVGTDLEVSANGRYLQYKSDGTPFYWMGDTPWGLFARINRADAELYLNNRQGKGITVIQAVAHWPWSAGGTQLGPEQHNTTNVYGHQIFTGTPSDPNTAVPDTEPQGTPDAPQNYWDHVDFIVRETRERGMHLAFVPTWGRDFINVTGSAYQYTEAEAYAYGEFLGARYKNEPHIIWVLGGDRQPVYPTGVDRRMVYRKMAEGIVKGVSGQTVAWNQSSPAWDTVMLTYHPPNIQVFDFHSDVWLDFEMVQTGQTSPNNVVPYINAYYARTPTKPVVLAESLYEGMIFWASGYDGNSPVEVRRSIYQSLFGGAKGYTYGTESTTLTSFDMVWGFGSGAAWKSRLDITGAMDIPHVNALLQPRNWHKHVPDQSIIISGAGSSGALQKRASRSTDGDEILVYYPTNSPAQVKNTLSAQAAARWFDPRDGTFYNATPFNAGETRTMQPPPALNEDAVLVLEAAAVQTPFNGSPINLPGTIEAEDYDIGGEGVSYHDTTPGSETGLYRPSDDVDIQSTGDVTGNYHIGWAGDGEWLEYTVNIASAGVYTLEARVATIHTGRYFHVEIDDQDVTGQVSVPTTGDWQNWQTVTKNGVSLPAGQHVLKIVFDHGSFNLNWIKLTGVPGGSEIIVDNADGAGVTTSGSWSPSTGSAGYYGDNYLHDSNTGGGKSVTFTPTFPAFGSYEVFARWTSHTNRASNAPVDVIHAGGTAFLQVNQQVNGGQWVSLGTYSFVAGSSGSVVVRNAGANGYVIADAVRFVPQTPAEIIVDSEDTSGITLTGSWPTSTYSPGYLGSNYRHNENIGQGTKKVEYALSLPASGTYEVFAQWAAHTNRATNVPIDIVHSGGTSTVTVNQTTNGSQWNALGTYSFNATGGKVVIRTNSTNGVVIADGIRLVKQ